MTHEMKEHDCNNIDEERNEMIKDISKLGNYLCIFGQDIPNAVMDDILKIKQKYIPTHLMKITINSPEQKEILDCLRELK